MPAGHIYDTELNPTHISVGTVVSFTVTCKRESGTSWWSDTYYLRWVENDKILTTKSFTMKPGQEIKQTFTGSTDHTISAQLQLWTDAPPPAWPVIPYILEDKLDFTIKLGDNPKHPFTTTQPLGNWLSLLGESLVNNLFYSVIVIAVIFIILQVAFGISPAGLLSKARKLI